MEGEQEDYEGYYSAANLSVPGFVKERMTEIVRGFESFRINNRLLDIGFGAGTILEAASDEGWKVTGLEVSGPAVELAHARGFDVFKGFLRDACYKPEQFDVVTASEILEHLESPAVELEEIARILRPGGLFWATTPSSTGLSRRLMGLDWAEIAPPEHTQLYSKRGIQSMLKDAGFGRITIRAHGTNPFDILRYFSKGKEPYKQFNRVDAAYSLNENLTSSPSKKFIKSTFNFMLDLSGLGDSLKIYAVKS